MSGFAIFTAYPRKKKKLLCCCMHSQLQHAACLPRLIIPVCLVLVSCYFTMKEISVASCKCFLPVTF